MNFIRSKRTKPGKENRTTQMTEKKPQMAQKTNLLSLPAELRAIIFSFALENVHCKYPVLVWDHISIANTAGKSTKGVGILLACRTTYLDCVDLIYNNAVLHMSVRGDTHGSTPFSAISLGPIQQCKFLGKLKHIQLEISYKTSGRDSVRRVGDRISKLSRAFKTFGGLKTVDLVFFDEGSRYRDELWHHTSVADHVIDAAMGLECAELVAVSRNEEASWSMSPERWSLLRKKAGQHAGAEEFREITFDYWEHSFRWKN